MPKDKELENLLSEFVESQRSICVRLGLAYTKQHEMVAKEIGQWWLDKIVEQKTKAYKEGWKDGLDHKYGVPMERIIKVAKILLKNQNERNS